ncbi:MAG: S-layer homology domain-containing protein [Clostridia bacterium]|nr:S-layer homology domain-containing protein [Clostridia bacterium]
MMKMKKFSAALLAVVMLISMLSCMVFSASAATTLGGPVTIEPIEKVGNQVLTGAALPGNIRVVNEDWNGSITNTAVFIKLDGKPYRATFGINAFSEIADAVDSAESNDTIYVAAGSYNATLNLTDVNQLKIYGPWAGVSPNNPDFETAADLAEPNPARPDANNTDAAEAAETEAVFYGTVNLLSSAQADAHTTLDGLYFAGSSTITLGTGGTYRIGTYLRNNVINVSTSQFVNMNRGMNPGFEAEYNRVLNGKQFHGTGGFMGSIHRYNYFNLTDYMFHPGSVQNGSSGNIALIECNYFENCAGVMYYGSNNYQTVAYSVVIKDNYIKQVTPGSYIVNNEYDSFHSMPGITFQITGNEIYGITRGTTVFQFPYRASEHNLNRYRYIVNITDNIIDLPVNQSLVNAEMAGVINCSYNQFLQGVALKQIIHEEKDCDVVLYPYYDAEWNLIGDARVISAVGGTVDQEDKKIVMELGDYAEDTMDLSQVLVATGDIKVYEDATLLTEVEDKILYFDSYMTTRYIAVLAPDGAIGNVYTLSVTKDLSQDAKLLKVLENHSQVEVVENGTEFTVTMPADVAFLDYELKVSAGAKVELFSDEAYTKALEIKDNYIPYGTNGNYYTVYVKITSEDGVSAVGYYSVVFERERSDLYDPSITSIVTPEGDYTIRPDRTAADTLWMAYYAGNKLLGDTVFEFTTTPGATYTVMDANGKVVSSSAAVKALPLKDGTNNFTIKVKDSVSENTMKFVVENGTRSSDATISGVTGQAPIIVDNTITLIVGGTTFSGTFETRSPYAKVKIYADEGKTIEMTYSSTPYTEVTTNRTIDERTFNLPTAHATNEYFVVSTAEDGTVKNYTLILKKNVASATYMDVANGQWYSSFIQTVSDAGIVYGEAEGEGQVFRPNDSASREEMATIIARLLKSNGSNFKDLKLNYVDEAAISEWALDNVKVAKFYDVMGGHLEGSQLYFMPAASITREEVMVVVARMLDLTGDADLSEFGDVDDISLWALDSVKATVEAGIFAGDENGNLCPRDAITRAEIATVAARIMEYLDY